MTYLRIPRLKDWKTVPARARPPTKRILSDIERGLLKAIALRQNELWQPVFNEERK